MRFAGRIALCGLACAAIFTSVPSLRAEHLTGSVVGADGKPITWIKERVFNRATGQYDVVLVPSVQIVLSITRGGKESIVGWANAERDGSFLITWDKNGDIFGLSYCTLTFTRKRHPDSPEMPTVLKLKLTSDAAIDADDPDNKALRQPIVVRSPDDSTSSPMRAAKGKKGGKRK